MRSISDDTRSLGCRFQTRIRSRLYRNTSGFHLSGNPCRNPDSRKRGPHLPHRPVWLEMEPGQKTSDQRPLRDSLEQSALRFLDEKGPGRDPRLLLFRVDTGQGNDPLHGTRIEGPLHGRIPGFVILTTAANASIRDIHHRMPLVLLPEQVAPWIQDEAAARRMTQLVPLGMETAPYLFQQPRLF